MPEMPDVEMMRRYLDRTSLHKRIKNCRVLDAAILDHISKPDFESTLKGNRFVESLRHGKHILVRLETGGWLALHFGMTGFLIFYKKEEDTSGHIRASFDFSDNGCLGYDSVRKLGRIGITENPTAYAKAKNLGIDALDKDATFDMFLQTALKNPAGAKTFLMRQDVLSGIGNIYSDEICFQAKIHPKKKIGELKKTELATLFHSIQHVLKTAIDHNADPDKLPGSFLTPFRTKKGKCPVCGGNVAQMKINGRTAYFCPACQKD